MTFLEKYANVILTGLNIQKGQNLIIMTEPVHWNFASVIAAEAYKKGARYVRVDSSEKKDPRLYRTRIEHSREEYLNYVPLFRTETQRLIVEENWALLALDGTENPEMLSTLDSIRNTIAGKAITEAGKLFQDAIQNNKIQWIVAFAPTEILAGKIMDIPPSKEAIEELWQVLVPILHLDDTDPSGTWVKRGETLKKRALALNRLKFKEIHFKGSGTDLKIGLGQRAVWEGGSSVSEKGIEFSPNLPTEEVFTAPDFRETEGRVKITRPVLVPAIGKVIEEAWLEFEKGKLVNYGAKKGRDVLDQYLEIDPAAAFLGEIALVDSNSPIFKSGKIFHNILFDENASCHIALGSAYPECFEGGGKMSDKELLENGINVSNLHTDFMIGSPDVDVTGLTWNGKKTDIIIDGKFVGDFA
ncbi:MAG: aminopeptidase [Cyclobacteriaceae bacterium]|nr:aminopeptidase [Cyclobacteriaceae bacterium]